MSSFAGKFARITDFISICAVAFFCSACAQTATTAAVSPLISPKEKSAVIRQLTLAKDNDWQSALDPSVDPGTKDDFLEQMNKADRAIKELTHGFEVSKSELDDALWEPPKSISRERRSALIARLEEARRE